MSRTESAAATRRALLGAAAELLDSGGPDAVTLREVGARAGVSRGAPYRHFADKEHLLTAVAAESWERIGDHMHALQTDSRLLPSEKLRAALMALITVSRQQWPPHHRQMAHNRRGTHRYPHRCGSRGRSPRLTVRSSSPPDRPTHGLVLRRRPDACCPGRWTEGWLSRSCSSKSTTARSKTRAAWMPVVAHTGR
jgi:AcrR family transcriptional regulator